MSVKVAVRCRPMNATEIKDKTAVVVRMAGDEVSVVDLSGGAGSKFCFDSALWSAGEEVSDSANPNASQEVVYSAIGAPLLEHIIAGYNGCIFAYGQTGSGKTYCMMGTEQDSGVVPRIAANLFEEANALKQKGVEVCVEVSYYEIYNEKVRCLLRPTAGGYEDSTLRIREHPKYGPFIEGLAKFVVSSQAEFLQLLRGGNRVRTTASTAMNATSSRSHAVFAITLTQKETKEESISVKTSKLNLVDLAGSERASKTMATGTRLAEGSSINKSLSCLGKVISALADSEDTSKQRHIPYRDSTLTWILKDNLGGNSKTVMLATISPSSSQYDETMSTLRYAERTKKIVNKAVVNEANNNDLVTALQNEIKALRSQLSSASAKERTRLLEELSASEAVKKDLTSSLEEKLTVTKRLMAEREEYMLQLEHKLSVQHAEIEELRAANEEKEKHIEKLLQRIKDFGSTSNATTTAHIEQIREEVAVLEQEQYATETQIRECQNGSTQADDFDTSLTLEPDGESTKLDDGGAARWGSSLGDPLPQQAVTAVASGESEPLDFDMDLEEAFLQDDADLENRGMVDSDLDSVEGGDEINYAKESIRAECHEELTADSDISLDVSPTLQAVSGAIQLNGSTAAAEEADESPAAVSHLTSVDGVKTPVPTVLTAASKGATIDETTLALEAFFTKAKEKPEIYAPSESMVSLIVSSDSFFNNRYLKEAFRISRVRDGALLSSKKNSVWTIDLLHSVFRRDCTADSRRSADIDAMTLFRVEKSPRHPHRLALYFLHIPNPFELEFASASRRQQFFELAMLLRRQSILWCPSLCPVGENDVQLTIQGTTIDRPGGADMKVNGEAKMTLARMPYEVIDVWYGCVSLEGQPLPHNATLFSGFFPKEQREVYVLGVVNVPSALTGHDDLARYFLEYLGSTTYFILANTTLTAEKNLPSPNMLIVFCKRSFIVRVSNIEMMDSVIIRREGIEQGDFSATGCAIRINESSIGVVMVNAKKGKYDAKTRAACLRSLISHFRFLNPLMDTSVQYDYFIVSGFFNFGGDFSSEDGLIREIVRNNLMSNMEEMEPSVALRTASEPMRIFYSVRHSVSRMDVSSYTTSRALGFPNVFLSADLFCQRSFLSVFGAAVPAVELLFQRLSISGQRLPTMSDMELLVSMDAAEGSPLSLRMMEREGNYAVSTLTDAVLFPCISNSVYIRLQTVTFSLLAVVGTASSQKRIVVASGVLPLKAMTLAAPMLLHIPMYYNGCNVATLSGVLHELYYEKNQAELCSLGFPGASGAMIVSHYENEVRQPPNAWSAASFPKDKMYHFSLEDPNKEQLREYIKLPSSDGQWRWLTEWRLDEHDNGPQGWVYLEKVGALPQLNVSATTNIRRRRWVRVMQASDPILLHNHLAATMP